MQVHMIVNLSNYECDVGSTCEPTLTKLLANHIECNKNYCSGKIKFVILGGASKEYS